MFICRRLIFPFLPGKYVKWAVHLPATVLSKHGMSIVPKSATSSNYMVRALAVDEMAIMDRDFHEIKIPSDSFLMGGDLIINLTG